MGGAGRLASVPPGDFTDSYGAEVAGIGVIGGAGITLARVPLACGGCNGEGVVIGEATAGIPGSSESPCAMRLVGASTPTATASACAISPAD